MLVLDVSPSMLTRDFDPDRLEVSKKLALDLLGRRPGDRFGLVLVAGGAFTQCPLTDDHRLVRAFIANARVGKLPEGTDLGSGISTAVNQLKDSKVRGKGIVVITDGGDNMGALRPRAAAAIARTLGVNVFVVGLGRNGVALAPTRARGATRYEFAERHHDFDETGLKTIAEEGEGDYFRVETGRDLAEISQQIQALEKSTVETTLLVRKLDLYFWFLTAALCLLLLEMLLRWGPLRVITV
jgi:Ca-activated chloride channel family protein